MCATECGRVNLFVCKRSFRDPLFVRCLDPFVIFFNGTDYGVIRHNRELRKINSVVFDRSVTVRSARWILYSKRQITYFGPMGGGAISINELMRVKVRTTDLGPLTSDFFWEFTDTSGQRLTIPGDAENASALFDALTVLKGADYQAVINASGSTEPAEFLVWENAQPARD